METFVYLVRHCRPEGQAPEAPLTAEGRGQAEALADFLEGAGIERIVSSPFARALQSIAPLARRLGIEVEVDARLCERVLSTAPRPDWRERLRESFEDLDLCLEGGESSRAAMARAVAVVDELRQRSARTTAIVSHGNLLTLLLRHFDERFGFDAWQRLTNPDVFRVSLSERTALVDRIWRP
jgi:2,3-bisphosphoglycerate-dependent phosphoglycerate mutase